MLICSCAGFPVFGKPGFLCPEDSINLIFCGTEVFFRVKKTMDAASASLWIRTAYYTGRGFYADRKFQDAAHWAEVQPDGQVKTMKNGRYSEWRIFPEAGNAPHYRGGHEVLNQAYGLALHEAGALLNEEGTFRTGSQLAYCVDQDISYSTHLGLGLWNVRACMNSLNARVRNGEVEQDTGTGGSWPISSDRVVWGMAAWEVYCLTGDADWLSLSCRVMEKTCMRDEQVLAATGGLMKGNRPCWTGGSRATLRG